MANNTQPELVLLMGLPAAGKSHIGNQMFADTHQFIDCDSIKATHPDYDPKNPQALHAWSQNECDKSMMNLFDNPTDAVYDSTGTNSERMVRYMLLAEEAGMTTRLVFVIVDLETSLGRNSRRERVVPEEVIRMKAQDIEVAFDICREQAMTTTVVENEWEQDL